VSESHVRRGCVKYLRDHEGCHIMAVENPLYPGTPDINGCARKDSVAVEFWVEVKYVAHVPKTLKLHHFTIKQKTFIAQRGHRINNTYLLLGIAGETLLLFKWADALLLDRTTIKMGYRKAIWTGEGTTNFQGMLDAIIQNQTT